MLDRVVRRVSTHPHVFIVVILSVLGAVVRARLAWFGGIWADEGLVLNIVAIPTWSGMIDFLRFHESHPPLFYILLRGWMFLAGNSNASCLTFAVVIGTAIVPIAYFTASSLFNRKVGIIAAVLVAVSPSLAEHSAQIRPYGLLPILVLLSCYCLIMALFKGGRGRWAGWVVSTACLLYTHNWTWLLAGGQFVAAVLLIRRSERGARTSQIRGLAAGCGGITILYLPWLSSLAYQVVHAGHTAPPLNGALDRIAFVVFGAASTPYMLLLGLYPEEKLTLVLAAAVASGAVLILARTIPGAATIAATMFSEVELGRRIPARMVVRFLLTVPVATLGAALVMSPRSNLLLERCVAILAPLVLLCIAWWLSQLAATRVVRETRGAVPLSAFAFVCALSIANISALWGTYRSNAREVALAVKLAVRPADLLIVAPEWYAPSFNHYFTEAVEQIDYPHPGRSGLLDFADVRTRAMDTVALVRLLETIDDARADSRRVWLITARRYLTYVDEVLPRLTSEQQRNRYTSVLRVKEARDALVSSYGRGDTSHFVRGRQPRYEEIVPILFEPDSSGVTEMNR